MKSCALASSGVVAAIIMMIGVWLSPGLVVGQAQTTNDSWTPPQTPWGDPDLQGIWGLGYVFTPLERPDELADKEFLTDEEVAALEAEHRENNSGDGAGGRARGERGTLDDVAGAYNQVFSHGGHHERVVRTKRTSLIVDPPDGKIPPLTPEAQKRVEAETASRAPSERADGPEDRGNDRCLGISLPFIRGAGTYSRLVQTPGSVAIYHEYGHLGGVYRMISLDGQSHLPPHIRQRLGDSRGRWEGDTLVVDTTNFTDKTNFEGSRENLHLVERFTRVAADVLKHEITIDDATTFTRRWTIELPLTKADNKQNQIYEAACHEGNYAMVSILAGARTLEREASK